MPQLIQKIKNERGSILVATIAFAIIMAIAGGGLMMLAGNSVNNEQAALENDQAFLAAESGLQIGLRWLADVTNWQTNNGANMSIYNGTINGLTVNVSLDNTTGSTIVKSDVVLPGLGYSKELSCGVRRSDTPVPGVFINNLGQNYLNDIRFDGPFQSNAPIPLGNDVDFVNGPVTVFNATAKTHFSEGGNWGQYGTGPSGNNYDFGVSMQTGGEGTYQGDNLDLRFKNTFTHSQDSLYLPPRLTNVTMPTLPQNLSATKRAILSFDTLGGVGIATYYYYNTAGDLQTPFVISNINNQIIRVPNEVSVLGIVKGQATVTTNPGFNIYPVSDLTYANFKRENIDAFDTYDNTNNYNVGSDQANFLALVSGKNIQFEDGYQQLFNKTTKTLYDAPSGATLYLTASLIATEQNCGIIWETSNGSTDPNYLDLSQFHYMIRAIGSRAVDQFFNYTLTGRTAANSQFRFFYDTRLLLNPAAWGQRVRAFRRVSSDNDSLFILTTTWQEQNIPID